MAGEGDVGGGACGIQAEVVEGLGRRREVVDRGVLFGGHFETVGAAFRRGCFPAVGDFPEALEVG